jgi:hypothetical protein
MRLSISIQRPIYLFSFRFASFCARCANKVYQYSTLFVALYRIFDPCPVDTPKALLRLSRACFGCVRRCGCAGPPVGDVHRFLSPLRKAAIMCDFFSCAPVGVGNVHRALSPLRNAAARHSCCVDAPVSDVNRCSCYSASEARGE